MADNVKKRGFTLIELLVVVSIIALLVSMLLPALGKAREQARSTLCKTNLKQQAMAVELYEADYKGSFPSKENCGSTYQGYGGKKGDVNSATAWDKRLLNPYVGISQKVNYKSEDQSLKVFWCPDDRGTLPGKFNLLRQPTVWDTDGFSYHYNSAALANSDELGLQNKRGAKVNRPGEMVLIADFSFVAYFFGWDPFSYIYWHNKDELGWANAVFVDSHVAYIKAILEPATASHGVIWQYGPGWTVIYNGRGK